ncbi:hypothetical protein RHO13_12765 [Orbus wheelerorum]|uniref:GNAT family N-acetyltransferase n=1 Tax=Orbus wheelerorum TaxID=3074111 RepID=UPI00370D7E82
MSLRYQQFKNIPLSSIFFDSLRNDYIGFDAWFNKKSDQYAFVSYDKSLDIDGFLYLKIENETIEDTEPKLPQKRRIKLGTFKIDAHDTKMGQRFIRKIIDFAIFHNVDEIYVTIFDKHKSLINLLENCGYLCHVACRKNYW